MKPIVTWVLIADGAQAKIFQHAGPGKGLVAVKGLSFEDDHLRAREIMADRPGRSYSAAGYGRSAMEYSTDPVQVREARFVKAVAETLEQKFLDGAFERLIIAAAPTALGNIRANLTDHLRQALLAELPKDLTNVPIQQLDKHFDGLLAV